MASAATATVLTPPIYLMSDMKRLLPHYFGNTNYVGYGAYDDITEKRLFELATPLTLEALDGVPLEDTSVPHAVVCGSNSLVFLGTHKGHDVAIKMFIKLFDDVFTDDVARTIADHGICPQIYFNKSTQLPGSEYLVSVMVMEQVTPLEFYPFASSTELRHATVSLICTVHRLHQMGKVHRDIKRGNLSIKSDGRTMVQSMLLDVDPIENITPTRCNVNSSSYCCHPPPQLCQASIRLRKGDTIIDWFSTFTTILGYMLNMEKYWGFDIGNSSMFREKEMKTSHLNQDTLFYIIRNNIAHMFGEEKISKDDPFWRTFCRLTHFFFVGIRTCEPETYDDTLEGLISSLSAAV